MKAHPLIPCALAFGWMLTSCSTGPRPPEPGTPAFFWGAAQETFKAGDLSKTNDDLLEIVQTDNEFAPKARIFEIAVAAGMVKGADDLAAAYEGGARMNRDNPAPFRTQVIQIRNMAGHAALDLAQQVHVLVGKEKGPQIAIEFPFPPGSAVEPAALRKIYAGVVLQPAEADSLQTTMLERGIVQTVCKLAGNADDPGKTAELFKASPVQVQREVYLMAVAQILYDESGIFGPNKLDQPQRLKVMCDEALNALSCVPESKETKALADKIHAQLKKLRLT